MRAARFQPFDRLEEMADRAGEAVEPHHNEDIAGLDLPHQAGELGAGARGAGAVLAEDHIAVGGGEFVGLRIRRWSSVETLA